MTMGQSKLFANALMQGSVRVEGERICLEEPACLQLSTWGIIIARVASDLRDSRSNREVAQVWGVPGALWRGGGTIRAKGALPSFYPLCLTVVDFFKGLTKTTTSLLVARLHNIWPSFGKEGIRESFRDELRVEGQNRDPSPLHYVLQVMLDTDKLLIQLLIRLGLAIVPTQYELLVK